MSGPKNSSKSFKTKSFDSPTVGPSTSSKKNRQSARVRAQREANLHLYNEGKQMERNEREHEELQTYLLNKYNCVEIQAENLSKVSKLIDKERKFNVVEEESIIEFNYKAHEKYDSEVWISSTEVAVTCNCVCEESVDVIPQYDGMSGDVDPDIHVCYRFDYSGYGSDCSFVDECDINCPLKPSMDIHESDSSESDDGSDRPPEVDGGNSDHESISDIDMLDAPISTSNDEEGVSASLVASNSSSLQSFPIENQSQELPMDDEVIYRPTSPVPSRSLIESLRMPQVYTDPSSPYKRKALIRNHYNDPFLFGYKGKEQWCLPIKLPRFRIRRSRLSDVAIIKKCCWQQNFSASNRMYNIGI